MQVGVPAVLVRVSYRGLKMESTAPPPLLNKRFRPLSSLCVLKKQGGGNTRSAFEKPDRPVHRSSGDPSGQQEGAGRERRNSRPGVSTQGLRRHTGAPRVHRHGVSVRCTLCFVGRGWREGMYAHLLLASRRLSILFWKLGSTLGCGIAIALMAFVPCLFPSPHPLLYLMRMLRPYSIF